MTSPIVVALDYHCLDDALNMASQLDPTRCRLKVGKELYTLTGPVILEKLHHLGFDVFLDLKFHDIPNTVANAVSAAADLGVWMVNVHASGGRRMMEACVDKIAQYRQRPLLIAVTVLTSMERSDLADLGLDVEPVDQVKRLALLTKESGLDGVVCSAQEAAMLKGVCGQDFSLVTPGIRPVGASSGDQRRIMTPSQAVQAGADYLVVGRPITQAPNPLLVLNEIYEEISTVS